MTEERDNEIHKKYHIDSRLAQIGSVDDPVTGAVSYPIYQATAFRHPALGKSTGFDYSRTKNPTRAVLEQAVADLESGDGAVACSTGMAALQVVFSLFSQGDHMIVSLDLYGGTYRLIEKVFGRFGITATYVDTNDIAGLERSLQPNTKAVFIETPTNPLMMITDLRTVSQWAKAHDLLTIVDNTLLTPYFQRPLELGADVVVHSATKYLGGHNDVLAGLVISKGTELTEQIIFLNNAMGTVLGAHDSWLLMRGMKTLALRMERHQQNATAVANFLRAHPLVEHVYYPALEDHPGYAIQNAQSSGNTGIFSFKIKSGTYVEAILRHIKLIAFAESLGGVESLMTYPMVQTHSNIPEEIRNAIGVDETLLRISCGIEHPDDLVADLAQAFAAAQAELEGSDAVSGTTIGGADNAE